MTFFLFIFFNILLCSSYLFPIGFTFLPEGLNTKIMMAAVGLLLVFNDIKRTWHVPWFMFGLFSFGVLFSCAGLFSVFYNETTDLAYASYFASMSVWLVSAYILLKSIYRAHGYMSIRLLVNYLLIVCILQCVLALIIDNNHQFKQLVDTNILQISGGTEFLNEVDRLYGIGAALDPAGVRFAAVLVLVSVILNAVNELSHRELLIYACSFLLLFGLGNLLSRTTTVGAVLGIVYLLCSSVLKNLWISELRVRVIGYLVLAFFLVFSLGLLVYLNMPDMQELIRYGFEAFFNWFEEGEFTTDSTETLNRMWVFPDNLKTWIIGDGWFANPYGTGGHYMYTDIGYLRFIFYCGTVGLFLFCIFFIYVARVLGLLYPAHRIAFYLLALLGFIVWIKVSTDLFQFYALMLVMACMPNQKSYSKTVNI